MEKAGFEAVSPRLSTALHACLILRAPPGPTTDRRIKSRCCRPSSPTDSPIFTAQGSQDRTAAVWHGMGSRGRVGSWEEHRSPVWRSSCYDGAVHGGSLLAPTRTVTCFKECSGTFQTCVCLGPRGGFHGQSPYHFPREPLVPEGRALLQTEQGTPYGGPKSCSNSSSHPC